jgi:structural maintenance of chromosome 3 (chondroitin sulfate proteoglycan 6)
MHIKKLTIRGFKSYSEQLEVDDFSEHHNVVVGRNGSGKSNFFQAICFVLCDDNFENLRKEERVELLHEGTGQRTLTAFVEILFDNADKRLPYDTDEVSLRRMIGLQRDEFFVNGKQMSKTDVVNMLESAGFSRSNPYYIVKQGKVNALALMSNKQRLQLLKEVAGTKVYEDRRAQSVKLFQQSIKKRENTNEINKYIEERLGELEEEKKELGEYEKTDKMRRALEYLVYERDRMDAKREIALLDAERGEESVAASDVYQAVREMEVKMANLQGELDSGGDVIRAHEEEVKEKTQVRSSLLQRRTELQLDSNELTTKVMAEKEKSKALRKESNTLDARIAKARKELDTRVQPVYERLSANMGQLELEVQTGKDKIEHLLSKQSRAEQFRTEEARDVFLRKQITDVEVALKTTAHTAHELERTHADMKTVLAAKERLMEDKSTALETHRSDIAEVSVRIEQLRVERNESIETRKMLWKTEAVIDERNTTAKEALARAERSLKSIMPPGVASGLDAVKRLMEEQSEEYAGVYGPLIGLIDVEKRVYTKALEVVGGRALFHVVVDTDQTAVKVMRHLMKEKAGRVTFIPLNRVQTERSPDSLPSGHDFLPMVSKIDYDEIILPAVMQVFGHTLICRDLETCKFLAEKYQMDCVTLDGDQILRQGVIRGGYHEATQSAMACMTRIADSRQTLADNEEATANIKRDVRRADVEVNTKFQEMQNLDLQRTRKRKSLAVLAHELEPLQRERLALEGKLSANQERLAHLDQQRTTFQTKVDAWKSELGTPLVAELTADEHVVMTSLKSRQTEATAEMDALREELHKIRSQKMSLEALLSSNLLFRRAEVTAAMAEGGSEQYVEILHKVNDELKHTIEHIVEVETALTTLNKEIASRKERMAEITELLESLSVSFRGESSQLDTAQKRVERMLNKRNLALQKRDSAVRAIRELGSLPSEEIEKFKTRSLADIRSMLTECLEGLQKYGNVNKKAMDQYVNFNDHRQDLMKRKAEIDASAESIKKLIRHLDRKKDEAIMRTFNGVQEHFAKVFQELVPSGKGTLILERSESGAEESATTDVGGDVDADPSESETDDDDVLDASSSSTPHVQSFIGVGVKVTFAGELESTMTSSLSGGQKALVALALIFAIQRCDPAPFYLFDEIDQALDGTHRKAVALLIQRQSHASRPEGEHDEKEPGWAEKHATQAAQFICSTFSPELVEVADTHFGVAHQHKVSTVKSFSHNDAMTFIQEIQKDTEAPVHHGLGGDTFSQYSHGDYGTPSRPHGSSLSSHGSERGSTRKGVATGKRGRLADDSP